MLIAFWLLLILYVCLTVLYAVTNTEKSKITPWPILPIIPKEESTRSDCKSHKDCPSSHVCLGGHCIRKLLGVHRCDHETGRWISYDYRGATFAICVCIKPHLVSQKYFGGNCSVNVGCGIHGRYVLKSDSCECDPGYKAIGLTCQKLPAIDFANLNPCQTDEIAVEDIKPSDGFHPDYVKSLSNLKCVKRPCSFDALSGRPLKHAKFEEDWGCVCDPRYGLFGVELLSSDKKYLSTPGFDACASIFAKEPSDPIDVKLITYFYLAKRDPISFILFDKLDEELLISPFKDLKKIILSQTFWQYDYAQYFFKTTPYFRARTRHITSFYIFDIETVNEWLYVNDFSPAACDKIPEFWINHLNPRVDAYNVLYKSPVCRVSSHDQRADPMFRNKVVVNPQHITFKEYSHLHRFNAFVLHYDPEVGAMRWTLDLDQEYNPNDYLSIDTNAPNYKIVMKNLNLSELSIQS